jgi:hypothetical protein
VAHMLDVWAPLLLSSHPIHMFLPQRSLISILQGQILACLICKTGSMIPMCTDILRFLCANNWTG